MKAIDRKRAHAERLYIEDGWTHKAIADTVGVTENTVGNWVKKYNWKASRDELLAAPHRIKRLIVEEISRVVKGEKAQFNTDDLSKLTTALQRVDKQVNVQVVISVFKEYDNWLAGDPEIDQEHLKRVLDGHKNFIKYRIDQEAWMVS